MLGMDAEDAGVEFAQYVYLKGYDRITELENEIDKIYTRVNNWHDVANNDDAGTDWHSGHNEGVLDLCEALNIELER